DACLAYELLERGMTIERQVAMPLMYHGNRLDCGYRVDFIVENAVIVEVKAVERIAPVHGAQLLTYLRQRRLRLGLLLNFNVKRLVDGGIQRVINGYG